MPLKKKSVKAVKRRPDVVKVTLAEAEKAVLAKAAGQAGIPLSIYVRAAALEKAQRETKSDD
jgi:hypothetical protein